MTVPKRKHWRQDTPRMQLVALTQAAQGFLLTMEHIEPSKLPERAAQALQFLDEAQEILRRMPEGEWKGVATHD